MLCLAPHGSGSQQQPRPAATATCIFIFLLPHQQCFTICSGNRNKQKKKTQTAANTFAELLSYQDPAGRWTTTPTSVCCF